MSGVDATTINARLAKLYKNGRQEVGLEVGADAGLSPSEYIQIPKSMLKPWAYRTVDSKSTSAAYERSDSDDVISLQNKSHWTTVDPINDQVRVVVYEGKAHVKTDPTSTAREIDDLYVEPSTYDDLRRFILANQGHIRDDKVAMEQVHIVYAIRFWSVITGLVVGDKGIEHIFVDDPTGDLSTVDTVAAQVMTLQGESVTAAAARATSWRKTNHATGGEIATGFPRRWLEQNGMWSTTGTAADRVRDNRNATTAFYVATHGVSVHNVLALMAPTDPGHWASIDPRCGVVLNWDVKESTAVRIAPMTQVAGVAMVVDSVVVLRMLVSEGLVPLLESVSQWKSLVRKHDEVANGGVRIATYAGWFLDGHPNHLAKQPFSQKDPSVAEMIGELAAVAVNYYKRSTIGQSPALENAARQLATTGAIARWAALARERNASTNQAATQAYRRITGAAVGQAITNLASNDRDEVDIAVGSYNSLQDEVGKALGISDPPKVRTDDLMKVNVVSTVVTPETTSL